MPIAKDVFTSSYNNYTNIFSWSHTCSGENRILVVGIVLLGDSPPAHDIVSCTYGSTLLTKLTDIDNTGVHIELWYMIAPPQGTAEVEITHDGTFTTSWCLGMATSYIGVDQTDPIDTYDSSVDTVNTMEVSLTTSNKNELLVAIGGKYEGSDLLIDGTDQIGDVITTGAGWGLVGAISSKYATIPGIETVEYTYADSSDGAMIALALNEKVDILNAPTTNWIKDSGFIIDAEVSYLIDESGNYFVDESGAYLQDSISTDDNELPHSWNGYNKANTAWADSTEVVTEVSTRQTAQGDTRVTSSGDTRVANTNNSSVNNPHGWSADEY